MITLIKILTWLASPIGILAALSLFAGVLHLTGRAPRTRVLLVTLGITQLLFFAWPPVAIQLSQSLEDKARALQTQNTRSPTHPASAILLLGGGITPTLPDPSHPSQANANEAFDRIMEAARLYHQGLAPRIIVSGGNSLRDTYPNAQTEAQAMKEALVLMGVPGKAIRLEDQSLTTRQNMANTAKQLAGWGISGKLALVTSATHIPRAYQNAVNAGLNIDVYPTDWITPWAYRPFAQRWLPNAQALEESERALKEWIALLASY